jgi:hypothetical protein
VDVGRANCDGAMDNTGFSMISIVCVDNLSMVMNNFATKEGACPRTSLPDS